MDMYLSESRINADDEKVLDQENIKPGGKSICHASVQLVLQQHGTIKTAKAKLDSCGSVSIAHSNLLNHIKPANHYKLPHVRLRGIGGKTSMLKKVGILQIKRAGNVDCEILCYVFNQVVGQTEEMLLISLSSIIEARINILHHMQESNRNECTDLQFWPNNKSFEEICKDVNVKEKIQKVTRQHDKQHPRNIYLSSAEFQEVEETWVCEVTQEIYMTEIQLRRIVDRNAMEGIDQQSDGDERMVKDGHNISKFSKEAMTLGDDVYICTGKESEILQKVYALYDHYVGEDRVFPIKNGAPRIMTKYKDTPYSYELQPEYAAGNKKFPCVKAMDWTGKTASAQVIRGFVRSTPVVESCALPSCISQLVIAPKFAPGQMKDDPDHGFRVCVNALINKCLKPYASTVPLVSNRRDQETTWLQVLSPSGWFQRVLVHSSM
jgi:hypothetical protein